MTCSSLFSVKASAATVILGDGANGSVTFDKPVNSNGYLNNRSVITKDGYLSIAGDTSVLYGSNSGSCNVVSNVPIDFTDVNSISISYDIISSPFDYSNIWFGFGLLDKNNNITSVNYREGNACCPKYLYGDSVKGLSSPIVLDTSEVTGNYYISFGYVTPYLNTPDTTSIKFYDLVLYNNDGSTTVIDDLIYTLDQTIDNVNDQIAENFGALGFAHDTVENFISLFNDDPPDPVITVPPLKMKIQGVEHQFFNGYQYDFRDMETGGLSVLVGAARTAGTLVLWWAFLQYCLKEFNSFFGGD